MQAFHGEALPQARCTGNGRRSTRLREACCFEVEERRERREESRVNIRNERQGRGYEMREMRKTRGEEQNFGTKRGPVLSENEDLFIHCPLHIGEQLILLSGVFLFVGVEELIAKDTLGSGTRFCVQLVLFSLVRSVTQTVLFDSCIIASLTRQGADLCIWAHSQCSVMRWLLCLALQASASDCHQMVLSCARSRFMSQWRTATRWGRGT